MLNKAIASRQVFFSDASYEGLSVVYPQVEVYSAFSPSISLMWQKSQRQTNLQTLEANLSKHHNTVLQPSFFLTLFTPQEIKVDGESQVKIWNYPYQARQDSIIQRFSQSYRSLPLRVRWGGELPLNTEGSQWTLFSGGQWTQWSQYINRVAEFGQWSDQVELSASFKWNNDKQSIASDLRGRPSPIPKQTGRTSYVDLHQLALAINASHVLIQQLHLKLNLQAHALLFRTDRKDPRALNPVIDEFPASIDQVSGEVIDESLGLQSNNHVYPGHKSSSWIWVAFLHLVWYK